MKKKIFIFILFVSLLTPNITFAQSPTKSLTPTPIEETIEEIDEKVDLLKNKVASRVAELNLVEKRGFIGTIKSISDSQITVTDLNNKNRIIQIDELTKYSSSKNENFTKSNIKVGSKISALGLYNKDSKKLLARFINEISIPVFISGVVNEKNDKEFTIKITTTDNKEYFVDIENITKTYELSNDELETSGFSKIKKMQNIFIVGFPDIDEENRISATKAIIVLDIPNNPNVNINSDSNNSTPSPTSSEIE
jgi:hypothetical protein